jgi:uncharacterized membrane protein YphA (DoxX/SURF4 family)
LNYSEMVTRFPDPFHIGTHASLAIALVSDGICSVHAVLGLATRWSALIISANVFVAWATVVHFQFFGRGVTPRRVHFPLYRQLPGRNWTLQLGLSDKYPLEKEAAYGFTSCAQCEVAGAA